MKTGEWPQHSVMQWHSGIRCVMDTCRCWHYSPPLVLPTRICYMRMTTIRPDTEAAARKAHAPPRSGLNTNTKTIQGTTRDLTRKKLTCAVLLLMERHCSGSRVGTQVIISVFWVPWQLRTLVRCRARTAAGLRQCLAHVPQMG